MPPKGLANCTRPDIAFVVNLLARFSSCPTKRYWKDKTYISIFSRSVAEARSCFSSSISFGDSYADTGNALHLCKTWNTSTNLDLPPYGQTFFNHSTGRASNGRLIIDFFAEHFGLPFVPPYFGVNGTKKQFGEGVNFAVGGATALEPSFLMNKGIPISINVSLGTELNWFKEMLANVCPNYSDCEAFLGSSLFLVGEIGGNDVYFALSQGKTKEDVQSLFEPIVTTISSTMTELIKLGAVTLVVPGNIPIGCLAVILSLFRSSANTIDYDPSTGCITWLNNLVEDYNEQLQIELLRLQQLHPHANIIYADFYSAAAQMYNSPWKYGFTQTLIACCGGGGPYNVNSSVDCGTSSSTSCDDPSLYVDWDGVHMTEAAYRLIAQGLLEGPFSVPQINSLCPSLSSSKGISES